MKNERLLSISLLLLLFQGVASLLGLMTWHKCGVVLIELLALLQIIGHGNIGGSTTLFRSVLVYYVYIIINTIINFLGKDISAFSTAMLEAVWWPSCFMLFYILICGNYNNKVSRKLSICAWLLIIVNSIFVSWNFLTYSVFFREEGSNANLIFYIICLLPAIAFIGKNSIRYILLSLASLICILSLKRSAMIACILVIIIDLLVEFRSSNRRIFTLLIFGVIFYAFYSVSTVIQDNLGFSAIARFQGIQDDGGSGRSDIYPVVWNSFKDFPFLEKLFGHGQNMVVGDKIILGSGLGGDYLSAHNDFLEILYDFGIVGLVLYILFLFRIYKMTLMWRHANKLYYKACLFGLAITLVISMFGHLVIYSTYYCYIVSLWGIIESRRISNNNF